MDLPAVRTKAVYWISWAKLEEVGDTTRRPARPCERQVVHGYQFMATARFALRRLTHDVDIDFDCALWVTAVGVLQSLTCCCVTRI